MELIILCTTTFIAAGLTLLSGFGLGTLLLPVFVIFFPVDLAISMTAVVHFFNNILKLMLLGSHADTSVVVRFGVPAILAAFVGAWVLTRQPYYYGLAGRDDQSAVAWRHSSTFYVRDRRRSCPWHGRQTVMIARPPYGPHIVRCEGNGNLHDPYYDGGPHKD